MPSQIADLFFFDGEKVEALADPQRSSALLRVGVHSLLGIDLVESLLRSLQQVERKRKTSCSSENDRAVLLALEQERSQLEETLASAMQHHASEQTRLDSVILRQRDAEKRFSSIGGDLFIRSEQLLVESKALAANIAELENELRDFAGGCLPLIIAMPVLDIAASRSMTSRHANDARRVVASLRERDKDTVRFVSKLIYDKNAVERVRKYLQDDLRTRYAVDETEATIISEDFITEYPKAELTALVPTVERVLSQLADARERHHAVKTKIDAVPSEAAVAEAKGEIERLRGERARIEAKLTLIDDEIASLRTRIDRTRARAESEAERLGQQFMHDAVSHRIVIHSARARQTLARFRERLLAENLHRLEQEILQCFQRLIRKTNLVNSIVLDPGSFQISVKHRGGSAIPAERLSAGERQLLAVATLWALAKASGRHLPAVIDTPLSRLPSCLAPHGSARHDWLNFWSLKIFAVARS